MTTLNAPAMVAVIEEVIAERHRQHARWGEQSLRDGTGGPQADELLRLARASCESAMAKGNLAWSLVLLEEVFEVLATDDSNPDTSALRAELIQVAAVALQWVEHIDRRQK